MTLTLSPQEAQLLRTELARQLAHMETELVHTDKFELQHALAADVAKLRSLIDKIEAQLAEGQTLPVR